MIDNFKAPTATLDPRVISAHSNLDPFFVQKTNAFAFELLSGVTGEGLTDNLFLSPASVNLACALLYNGAAGETAEEIAAILNISDENLNQVNRDYELWALTLKYPHPDVGVTLANAIWMAEGVEPDQDFRVRVERSFDAAVENLDFTGPESAELMNDWVREITQGRIDSIVDGPLNSDLVSVLTNAIYFKALWTYPFSIEETTELPFTRLDGSEVDVMMMSKERLFSYLDGGDFQMVSLPYGGSASEFFVDSDVEPDRYSVSFYVILPDEEVDFTNFLRELKLEDWQTWIDQLEQGEGTVKLPRFRYAYELDLIPVLKSLGMTKAFSSGQSDFSAMYANANGYFGKMTHKTYIDVNEEGTEAAAATVGEQFRAARFALEPIPFQFTADHPFIFLVRDNSSGTILFMGVVIDPLDEGSS
jgi:serpin B